MEKAVQAEAETFTNLELRRDQAKAVLGDEPRLKSNIQVSQGYLTRLEAAVCDYEQAVTILLTSLETDVDQKAVYTNKLNEQMKLVDPILNELQNAVDFFKAVNKAARVFACIKLKIRSMQKTIDAKIAAVRDAEKEEDMLSSLPKIKANLRLLEDVVSNTTKELDSVCKQIVKEELTERDVNILLEEATQMVDSSREITSGLRAKLLEAAAAIDEEEPKEDSPNTVEGLRAKLLEAAVAIDEEKSKKVPLS